MALRAAVARPGALPARRKAFRAVPLWRVLTGMLAAALRTERHLQTKAISIAGPEEAEELEDPACRAFARRMLAPGLRQRESQAMAA